MKFKQQDMHGLASFFAEWRGENVFFAGYVNGHDRFTIGWQRSGVSTEFIGVTFVQCLNISGPVRWSGCDIQCEVVTLPEGEQGIEIRDRSSGFVVQCEGPVIIGGGTVTYPE
ncbi:hypothetical protein [Acidovorax sp. A1169]|uniref:hypothetical protein n=1 Tax=Acidovorax sp. A1169 TaxID=3059524 RepID=UPI002737FA61|nr:hypothetical protein [Acidovorax sp. A1169]MDP4076860.1 hypothetical protein [Acidovorax sp. A1169]